MATLCPLLKNTAPELFLFPPSYYGLSQVWGVKPALPLLAPSTDQRLCLNQSHPWGMREGKTSTGLWPNSTPSSTSCGMRDCQYQILFLPKREFPGWTEMRIEPKALEILLFLHDACSPPKCWSVYVWPGVKKEVTTQPSISTLVTKVTWAPLFLVIFKTPPGTLAISPLSQVLCPFPISLPDCGKHEKAERDQRTRDLCITCCLQVTATIKCSLTFRFLTQKWE